MLNAQRTPMVMGLKELLEHWVIHQIEILQGVYGYRAGKADSFIDVVDTLCLYSGEHTPSGTILKRIEGYRTAAQHEECLGCAGDDRFHADVWPFLVNV